MSYFEWDPVQLSLNVPEMDREHQVLIAYMNKIQDLKARAAPKAALIDALALLARYTAQHFAAEEQFMERMGYPGLRVHKGVHRLLLDRLAEYQRTLEETGKVPADLFVFFKMWLTAHIRGIDMKYARHCGAQGQAA